MVAITRLSLSADSEPAFQRTPSTLVPSSKVNDARVAAGNRHLAEARLVSGDPDVGVRKSAASALREIGERTLYLRVLGSYAAA